MSRDAVAILVGCITVLPLTAWLMWDVGVGPSVEDLAGVYRFDPHAGVEAVEVGPDDKYADLLQGIQQALNFGTLTLKSDGSATWTMNEVWREKGRWEVKDDRVFLFLKREGRRESPVHRPGLLVRDGTLVLEGDEPLVLRKQ